MGCMAYLKYSLIDKGDSQNQCWDFFNFMSPLRLRYISLQVLRIVSSDRGNIFWLVQILLKLSTPHRRRWINSVARVSPATIKLRGFHTPEDFL